jgi:hypothetical protein
MRGVLIFVSLRINMKNNLLFHNNIVFLIFLLEKYGIIICSGIYGMYVSYCLTFVSHSVVEHSKIKKVLS